MRLHLLILCLLIFTASITVATINCAEKNDEMLRLQKLWKLKPLETGASFVRQAEGVTTVKAAQLDVPAPVARYGKEPVVKEPRKLNLPEITYEPPPLVTEKGEQTVSQNWVLDYVRNSPQFQGAKVELAHDFMMVGGMVKVLTCDVTRDGKTERVMIKYFSPDRPYFAPEFKSGMDWEKTAALMMQRHLGLQQYISDVLEKRSAALGRPLHTQIAKVNTDPYFIRRGILIQPEVTGQRGPGLEDAGDGPGRRDLFDMLSEEHGILSPVTAKYFGNRNPRYLDSTQRGIDEGNDWENFFYKSSDGTVTESTLFDW